MEQVFTIEQRIKEYAKSIGFLACGFSKSEELIETSVQTKQWLENGYHGEMHYMENHFEKRMNPSLLVNQATTVISLAYNYFPQNLQNSKAPKIAKYAYGEDYHKVVKDKCYALFEFIKTIDSTVTGRVFVDSGPVMERQWAQRSGLGWIGKNSLLLMKGVGSFFFLAEIICSLELTPDKPTTSHCGNCTACIDACPTQAIVADGVVDATQCISYLSIEKRNLLTDSEKSKLNGWLFGCDICQDVCPWNSFSEPTNEDRFKPIGNWLQWDQSKWNELTQDEFNESFKQTPLERAGFPKIMDLLS